MWESPGVALWRRLGEIRNGPSRRGDTSERTTSGALGSARILIRLVWGTIVRLQIVHGAIAYLSELFLYSHACLCIPHRHVREGTFQRRREKNTDSGIRVLSFLVERKTCVCGTLLCVVEIRRSCSVKNGQRNRSL